MKFKIKLFFYNEFECYKRGCNINTNINIITGNYP